jgi:hypothetical protein
MSLEDKIKWANRYIDRGWSVFVLGRDKTPLPNCTLCKERCPGRGNCICMSMYCHGFYAATMSRVQVVNMIHGAPDGMLGIRLGDGLAALDFEGTEKGCETFDNFESYTGGVDLPRYTLAQRTGSGGIHLIIATGANLIKSRNRVLPDMDVKASGGYIAVGPGGDGRHWTGWDDAIVQASPGLLTWLTSTKGNFGGQGGAEGGSFIEGGDWYRNALKNGCPGGLRDEFFNRLIFGQRKSGVDRAVAENKIAEHWWKCQQNSIGGEWRGADYDMPWEHVLYKIDRTWATVEPDEVPEWQTRYVEQLKKMREGENVKVGRVMIGRRK